jgi:predicted MPP superfamily phosphohydrolase
MRSRFFFVLGLLALLHLYIGTRLLPALPIGGLGRTAGALLLVLSCILMPMALMARSIRRQPWSDRLAWAGYLTMSVFSSLLLLTLIRDLVLGLSALLAPAEFLAELVTASAIAVPVLTLVTTLIGLFNALRRARVVEVDVPIRDLPLALQGFTIAQITDIHVGPTIKRGYLDAIVDAVNALRADVIAVTGDLVDGSVRELSSHTQPLSRLNARHGAFFVTGNHEYYSGASAWTAEVTRLGLRVLTNEHVVLQHDGAALLLAGVSDYGSHHFDPAQRSDPAAAIAGAPAQASPRILLAHQPRSATAASAAGFDLQISGHTHGGQFWPWNLFVRLQQPFTAGLHRLNDLWIYISRGTGYWGPPNRFGVPSEITRLRLVAART